MELIVGVCLVAALSLALGIVIGSHTFTAMKVITGTKVRSVKGSQAGPSARLALVNDIYFEVQPKAIAALQQAEAAHGTDRVSAVKAWKYLGKAEAFNLIEEILNREEDRLVKEDPTLITQLEAEGIEPPYGLSAEQSEPKQEQKRPSRQSRLFSHRFSGGHPVSLRGLVSGIMQRLAA